MRGVFCMKNRILIMNILVFCLFVFSSCKNNYEEESFFRIRDNGTSYLSSTVYIETDSAINRDVLNISSSDGGYVVLSFNSNVDSGEDSYYSVLNISSDLRKVEEYRVDPNLLSVNNSIYCNNSFICVDGLSLKSIDINTGIVTTVDNEFDSYIQLIEGEDGFYSLSENQMNYYDFAGNKLNTITIEDNFNYMYKYPIIVDGENLVLVEDLCPEIKYYNYDANSGTKTLIYTNTECNFLYSGFYGKYYTNYDGIYCLNFDTKSSILIAEWNNIDICPQKTTLEKDINYIINDDSTFYVIYEYVDGSCDISICIFDETLDYSNREKITIGGYGAKDDLAVQWAVYTFNTSQSEYRAVIDDYRKKYEYWSAQEADAQRAQLLTDFQTTGGPDIFYGSDFDFQYWGRSGMVIDMLPYINGSTYETSDITTNIWELMCKNDKCYQVFSSYYVTGYFGSDEFFFDTEESIYDVQAVSIQNNMPLYCQLFAHDVADMTLRYQVEDIVSSGTLPSMQEMEDIVSYAINEGVPVNYEIYDQAFVDALTYNDYLLIRLNVSDVYQYTNFNNQLNGNNLVFVGFPSIIGSSHTLVPIGSMAISSNAKNYDICWELISSIFSPDVQRVMVAAGTIPVNNNILIEYLDNANNHSHVTDEVQCYYIGMVDFEEISEQDVNNYLELIYSLDTVYTLDWGLFSLISDEIDSYWLQNRTIDSIANSLLERYELYLSENY